MVLLGSYWSIQAYLDWQANPVLTTVNTTAYPVKSIEFPAVTICGQGMNDDVITAGMFKQFFNYLWKQNLSTVNPLEGQYLIYVKVREPRPLVLSKKPPLRKWKKLIWSRNLEMRKCENNIIFM